MRKIVLFALLLLCMGGHAKADGIPMSFGSLDVNVPFQTVRAVGLWDFKGKRGMTGAETPLATYKNIEFVGGGITSLNGKGTPFLGFNLSLSEPIGNSDFAPIIALQPGVFAGRDFNNNAYIVGVKVSTPLW